MIDSGAGGPVGAVPVVEVVARADGTATVTVDGEPVELREESLEAVTRTAVAYVTGHVVAVVGRPVEVTATDPLNGVNILRIAPDGTVTVKPTGRQGPTIATEPDADDDRSVAGDDRADVPDTANGGGQVTAGGRETDTEDEDDRAATGQDLERMAEDPAAWPVDADMSGQAPRDRTRRWLLIGGLAAAGVVATAGAMLVLRPVSTPATSDGQMDRPSSMPRDATTVTLPGWDTVSSWAVSGVTDAAAAGTRVLGIVGAQARIWEAGSGAVVDVGELPDASARTMSGFVGALPSVAAISDTLAMVWTGEERSPIAFPLASGEKIESRTGALLVTGRGRTFWAVTSTGRVPLVAPGAEMVVLAADGDTVIWASGAQHVIVASPNGAVLSDAALNPPVEGARVTPKTGWFRGASRAVTIVGWTLPDGRTLTGIHDTSTGALLSSLPGGDGGILSPDRVGLVSGEYLISLAQHSARRFQDDFVATRWLGNTLLYGGLRRGGDAILAPSDDMTSVPVPAATVIPFAVADETLLTLTGDRLAAFPSTDRS